MTELDLDDIQGVILRGYRRMGRARHLLLRIDEPAAFKRLLGDLATEDRASGPFVTVASDWLHKPPAGEDPTHCVNIGLTFDGLRALGVADESLASFPADFREGAVARAGKVGDTGANDPRHWIEALRPEHHQDVHVVLSLYALTDEDLAELAEDLRARAGAGGAASVLHEHGAKVLYEDAGRAGTVHFGYRDGLSQPTIAGVPAPASAHEREPLRDPLPEVPAGDFVLGHESSREGYYPVPGAGALGRNGSFAAFRILEQDVRSFDDFIRGSDGDPDELLAARICGRWRNGVPLVMSPDSPDGAIAESELNGFDFGEEHPDPRGERCPLGSHIRRANPRRQPGTPGDDAAKRRIVRRGLPYGKVFDPASPDDGEERGLIGMFICVSLRDQYESMMRLWINDGAVAPGLGRTRDPLCGNVEPADAPFVAPGDPKVEVTGLPRFVTTRGGAYLFLPSMTALRRLAAA